MSPLHRAERTGRTTESLLRPANTLALAGLVVGLVLLGSSPFVAFAEHGTAENHAPLLVLAGVLAVVATAAGRHLVLRHRGSSAVAEGSPSTP